MTQNFLSIAFRNLAKNKLYSLINILGFKLFLTVWTLGSCCLCVLPRVLIAWVTVGGNAVRVARAKPVEALRYE